MDVDQIVTELKMERGRLEQAIAALEGGVGRGWPIAKSPAAAASQSSSKKRGGITAAGRRRLSEAVKARWAARRSTTANGPRVTSATQSRPKRVITAAARKRISEAVKKSWADKRKASSRKAVGGSTSTE